MSELLNKLRNEFQDPEYRHAYAEECVNTMIATQIKVLREEQEMTQGDLALKTGMKQPRIPLLEDSNYANWTLNTLKRLARAFDLALSVKFEAFSDVIMDFEAMSRETLQRPAFARDPFFSAANLQTSRRFRRRPTTVDAQKEALGQKELFGTFILSFKPTSPAVQEASGGYKPERKQMEAEESRKPSRPLSLQCSILANQGGSHADFRSANG